MAKYRSHSIARAKRRDGEGILVSGGRFFRVARKEDALDRGRI